MKSTHIHLHIGTKDAVLFPGFKDLGGGVFVASVVKEDGTKIQVNIKGGPEKFNVFKSVLSKGLTTGAAQKEGNQISEKEALALGNRLLGR